MSDLIAALQGLGDAEHDDLSIAHDALAEIVQLRILTSEQQDEIERLRAEITDARRTAKYWKAEHLAGNGEIERLLADRYVLLHRLRERGDEIERLRAALIAAMEIVQVDRTSLFETSRNRATGAIDDPADQTALDDYDRVIAQTDAALGEKG